MSVLTPLPGVRQITHFGPFSCHLIESDDGLTLIDTIFPGSVPAILAEVQKSGRPLRRVLITHAHMDHVGSLDALVAAVPGIEIVASARTAQLLAGDRTLQPDEKGMSFKGGVATTKTRPTRILEDGDEIAGFRLVTTPGHCVGHASYFELATGNLFSGDALISAGGGLHVTGVFRIGFPFPYFATASRERALASARKLARLAPRAILPVHGPAVTDAGPALSSAIAEAERAFAPR